MRKSKSPWATAPSKQKKCVAQAQCSCPSKPTAPQLIVHRMRKYSEDVIWNPALQTEAPRQRCGAPSTGGLQETNDNSRAQQGAQDRAKSARPGALTQPRSAKCPPRARSQFSVPVCHTQGVCVGCGRVQCVTCCHCGRHTRFEHWRRGGSIQMPLFSGNIGTGNSELATKYEQTHKTTDNRVGTGTSPNCTV